MAKGSTIAITSGKGGVGKTTVSAGIAQSLCERGYKVLTIDGDLDFRNLDMLIGLDDGFVFDLNDVIEGRCELSGAIYKSSYCSRLYFLAGTIAKDNLGRVNQKVIQELLIHLKNYFDYIIIDTAAGLGHSFELYTSNADMILIVTTLYKAAVRDSEKIAGLLEEENKKVHLVVNMVDDKLIIEGNALNIDNIMDNLGVPLIGLLPVEQKLIEWQNKGESVHNYKSTLKIQFDDIAARICGETVPLKKFWK